MNGREFDPVLVERWLSKIDSEAPNGCWRWTGWLTSSGYGMAALEVGKQPPKRTTAHRAIYELHVGPIEPGLQLDHLCRNRACVNPAHLEPVTPHENSLRGEQHRRTHCPQGHEYTPNNTYNWPRHPERRQCRTCMNEAQKRYEAKKSAS